MIYKTKIFCFETVFVHGIACALRWGITLVREFLYWVVLTPSWENIFKCWKYTRRWKELRFNWEEDQIWLYLYFSNKILGKNSVPVYVMSQSCNKTHFCMIYVV